MVFGVVPNFGRVAAGDDAAGGAVACAGRFHGVFTVITGAGGRQQIFAVAKGAVVLAVRVRAALKDQSQSILQLGVAGMWAAGFQQAGGRRVLRIQGVKRRDAFDQNKAGQQEGRH